MVDLIQEKGLHLRTPLEELADNVPAESAAVSEPQPAVTLGADEDDLEQEDGPIVVA